MPDPVVLCVFLCDMAGGRRVRVDGFLDKVAAAPNRLMSGLELELAFICNRPRRSSHQV